MGAGHGLSRVCSRTTRRGGVGRPERGTSDGHAWILGGLLDDGGGDGYTGPDTMRVGRGLQR